MTTPFAARPAPRPAQPRKRGALVPTLIILALLGAALYAMAQVWTEVLWYQQLGYTDVLWREWLTRAVLFVVGFLVMGGAVWLNLHLAYANRRVYAPATPEERNLDRYRESIEPLRRVVLIGAPVLLGFFAGGSLSAQWRTVLMWLNREQFGESDPEFGLDISFFVFSLPVARTVVSGLMTVVFFSAVAALLTHYLYGGITTAPRADRVSKAARIHLSILAAVFVLLIALSYWLDRYSLLVNENNRFAGASYTDIHAVMPGRTILAVIALVVMLLFLVGALRGTWQIPAAAVGTMIISGIVVGGVYPAVVERFQVEPNAVDLEEPFIQRNIDGTLRAYGMEGLETQTYAAETEAEAGQLREDSESTTQIRLLDPNVVSDTFRQLQQNRQYYNFADTLAVDRYEIDGELRDTVIGVRELNQGGLDDSQRTWVNDHTVYTHGFGVVAAYGNTVSSDGRPAFFQRGIPSTGELGDYEPRVYFGEGTTNYSIVGAPEGVDPWEVDYPDDDAPNGQVMTTYSGDGGPSLGNLWNQLLYAIKLGDMQILFSDRVTEESQILYDRDPKDRVRKVAPYLELDGRAYPAVVDTDDDPETAKQLVWIVDGYTTSNNYPYSARASLEDATTDALTQTTGGVVVQQNEEINYIRNSVKAIVNAYDGSVQLYEWDENDPVLDTWQNIFPDHVEPMSEISGDLMAHLRYPEDLFKVQRELLTNYHVTDAETFYQGSDQWSIPADPTEPQGPTGQGVDQPPYFLTLQMPGQDAASFSLTSSFIPGGNTNRNVLTGFLAVDAEAGDTPGERREGFGQLRMLELPRDLTVPGPGQVQNNFNADPTVSTELNLLERAATQVTRGNLLTLPVGGGLLYVQPVYVQSSGGTSFPLLQRVLVAFGDEIGFAPTLDEALDQVFGGDSGAQTGDEGVDREDVTTDGEPTEDAPADGGTTEVDAGAQARLTQALEQASQALQESDAALAEGDWAAYGEAQERLQAALEEALTAEGELSAEDAAAEDAAVEGEDAAEATEPAEEETTG